MFFGVKNPFKYIKLYNIKSNTKKMLWLIYGGHGWIGTMVKAHLVSVGETVVDATARADDEVAVEAEIRLVKPVRIMSFVGRTHGPAYSTIDYLEQKGKISLFYTLNIPKVN